MTAQRFLVVGAGGIGGILSAYLNEQGHDVVTLTRNALIADAVNAHGFRVRGDASPGTVRGRALTKLPRSTWHFDTIFLATQPPQVEEAAQSVVECLKEAGLMVCLQNGLCEERIVKIAGVERVVGAIVTWGATMTEPGVYDRTSAGGFQIGRVDGGEDDRVDHLAQILECVGPTSTTTNLLGARWSKLAINCAISSLGTIGGDRLGVLMRKRHVRRLALEIMTEVVEVARASRVWLEKVAGTIDLDWIALNEADKISSGSAALVAKHALLLAVGARYRRLRSSMLAAIERGRPPAVEFLNGEIISRGKERGVPTPINVAVRDEVLKIAAKKSKSSHDALLALYERTRSLVPQTKDSVPLAPTMTDAPRKAHVTSALEPLPQALDPSLSSNPGDIASRPPEPEPPAAVEVSARSDNEAAVEAVEAPVHAAEPDTVEEPPHHEDAAPTEREVGEMPADANATIIGAPRLEEEDVKPGQDPTLVGAPKLDAEEKEPKP